MVVCDATFLILARFFGEVEPWNPHGEWLFNFNCRYFCGLSVKRKIYLAVANFTKLSTVFRKSHKAASESPD